MKKLDGHQLKIQDSNPRNKTPLKFLRCGKWKDLVDWQMGLGEIREYFPTDIFKHRRKIYSLCSHKEKLEL